MSGFDFDALRDPEAPIPGRRERDGVNTRARHLRARQLRNRVAVTTTAFVVVAATVLGVVAATRNTGPKISVEGGSTTTTTAEGNTARGSVADRFVPPTTVRNGVASLIVTLPYGKTILTTYPASMQIAQLGYSGTIGINYDVQSGSSPCCGSQVKFSYTTVQQIYGDAKPIAVYAGVRRGKPVRLFHGSQAVGYVGSAVDYLVFQFGPWLVQVSDPPSSGPRMTDAQRAVWARSLSGKVDANGYLLLRARAPLTIGNEFEGGFGSAEEGNFVDLATNLYCGQPESDTNVHSRRTSGGKPAVGWCDRDLHVLARGTTKFVDLAATKLEILNKLVSVVPAFAVSASFVSADEGWVLEQEASCGATCNYQLAHTTDGGTQWSVLSELRMRPDLMHIRFADSLHGFAFRNEPSKPAALSATDDGGVHWKSLTTPFSNISDLAISRGVVYVVGISSTASRNGPFPGFRIWSSPVSILRWTIDPLTIPVGAGPVPEQQLVLNGDHGWMINSDRGVGSGARLSPTTGRWSAWTPPCLDVHGSAVLAASTTSDLVAVCSPGFATSSTTTYIEFSHDGGTTFKRQAVPGGRFGAGGPLSPEPHTAVIGQGVNLQRTTDDGATWHVVLNHDPSLIGQRDTIAYGTMVDFGFTTPTQGFIITDGGTMLMTLDSGATWQKVTFP